MGKERSVPTDWMTSRRFLMAMMSVSLTVHLALFWSFSSVQMFQRHIVADLTFENLSEPPSRVIPRPRSAAPEPVDLDEMKDIRSVKASGSAVPPSISAIPSSAVKGTNGAGFVAGMSGAAISGEAAINVPSVPGGAIGRPGMHISQWRTGRIGDGGDSDFSNSRTYLEIVKLKIEKNKRYPEEAKRNHIEGTVGLKFIITTDGGIKNMEIGKSSRNALLDEAAMQALIEAAPFPKPPERFFKGDISLQLSIIFELT